jgi:elongation factor 1-beta
MKQTQNLVGCMFPGVRLTCYSYGPSQADVVSFKAFKSEPPVEKYPYVYRWYNHIKSHESEFSTLPGDPSKAYTTYGPESVAVAVNPKNAPAEEEDDMDLFGSDEEEEDPEVVAEREKRLADYKKKKEGKAKPAAKSIVTLDVKPWGAYSPRLTSSKRS